MITGGFGATFDLESGVSRAWYLDASGVRYQRVMGKSWACQNDRTRLKTV